MTNEIVFKFFKDLPNKDPRITKELVTNGYKQKQGGYIELARQRGVENPSQHWHLTSYCKHNIEEGQGDKNFRFTPCGEMLIYMAEASYAVDTVTLENLVREIINSNQVGNRRYWNNRIKDVCWDAIKATIDNLSK